MDNKKIFFAGVIAAAGAFTLLQFDSSDNVVKQTEVSNSKKQIAKPKVLSRNYSKTLSKSERNMEIIAGIGNADVSEAILDIVGLGEKADYKERMAGIKKLTRDINDQDKAALVGFLYTQYTSKIGMREIAFNAVKNDVLDVLLRQNTLVEGLGQVLSDMANDDTYGDMWRDYSVQFFAGYYEQAFKGDLTTKYTKDTKGLSMGKRSSNPTTKYTKDTKGSSDDVKPNTENRTPYTELTEERSSMLDTYWLFAENPDSPSAGTALLGLKYLSRNYTEIDQERIVKVAVDIVNDDDRPLGPKITALRMFDTQNGDTTVDDTVRESVAEAARITAQTGENTVLRMAAVATLGDVGSDDDIELLESMLESEDKNMRRIAQAALDKLQK